MPDIIIPTDIAQAIEQTMPPEVLTVLAVVVQEARASRTPCYLVGGPVRDLLLGYEFDDLDLVFEGDALEIAERCAALTGGELVRHEAFATGKLAFNNTERPYHIDFITARRETYPYPASLPVVEPSTLADDLMRRDFTINTLAIRLDGPPALIDQLGGVADLERGTIQVLHDRSFIDDPTRILRGARFAARLHFTVEPHTDALVRQAGDLDMIAATTPARILNEVWLAFQEPEPEVVFAILAEQRILPHIFPGLRWRPEIAAAFQAARQACSGEARRLLLLGLSVWWLDETERGAVLRHYPFNGGERRRIVELDTLHRVLDTFDVLSMPPSALDRALHDLSETTLTLGMIVASTPEKNQFATYLQELRPTVTLLDGNDLRSLGIAPGPRFRVLLEGLRAAQLDGIVSTRDEARRWVSDQNTSRL